MAGGGAARSTRRACFPGPLSVFVECRRRVHLPRGGTCAPSAPPEYVAIALPHRLEPSLGVAMSQWNLLWEAAQFRRYIDTGDLPPQLAKVAGQGDVNVVFVPRTSSRYYEYAPLFHLLSRSVVERHGLPLRERGQWPFLADWVDPDGYMPVDFADRLSRAWGGVVWRHLMPGSARVFPTRIRSGCWRTISTSGFPR